MVESKAFHPMASPDAQRAVDCPCYASGRPLGPLIMTLWVMSGGAIVNRQCQRDNSSTRVYVDDRSVVDSALKLRRRRDARSC